MDAELRERFMKLMRNKNSPNGMFTKEDVEATAAAMEREGKAVLHITFPDGGEVDIPVKDALLAYWGFEEKAKEASNDTFAGRHDA